MPLSEKAKALGNEPAFPHIYEIDQICDPGMSKRECFAALAMQGILAHSIQGSEEGVSGAAVKHADSLLEELAKTS